MTRRPLTPLPLLPKDSTVAPAASRWNSAAARVLLAMGVLALGAGFAVEHRLGAQTSLNVTYGPGGLAQLSWHGLILADVQRTPSDAFHIWHMKVTDLEGNVLAQDGWGESNLGRQWDPADHSWTYRFSWGSIRTQYVAAGDDLNLVVTETNLPGSGVILAGASIYPLVLHLPALPTGFGADTYPMLSDDSTAPGVGRRGLRFGRGSHGRHPIGAAALQRLSAGWSDERLYRLDQQHGARQPGELLAHTWIVPSCLGKRTALPSRCVSQTRVRRWPRSPQTPTRTGRRPGP